MTSVTSDHMNSILGSVLKLINNNIDAPEAPWMKRIAGKDVVASSLSRQLGLLTSVHTSDHLEFIDQPARAVHSACFAASEGEMRRFVRARANLETCHSLGIIRTRGSRVESDESTFPLRLDRSLSLHPRVDCLSELRDTRS